MTKNVAGIKKSRTFATALREKCIANNKQIKKIRSVRLGVRTQGFHPCNRGSIPLRTTNKNVFYTTLFLVE